MEASNGNLANSDALSTVSISIDPTAFRSTALTSGFSVTGHCLDEPGSAGWKKYQTDRKQNLKELKEERQKKEKIREQVKKINQKIDYLIGRGSSHLLGILEKQSRELAGEVTIRKPKLKAPRSLHSNKSVRFSRPIVLPSPNFSRTPFLDRALLDKKYTTEILPPTPILSKWNSVSTVKSFTTKRQVRTTPKTSTTTGITKNANKVRPRTPVTAPSRSSGTIKSRSRSKSKLIKVSTPTGIDKRKNAKTIGHKSTPKSIVEQLKSKVNTALAQTQIPIQAKSTKLNKKLSRLEETRTKPPRLNFVPNTPFPGTPEWDKYWVGYHKALDKFDKEMNEFSKGVKDYQVIIDGYKREAKKMTSETQHLRTGLDYILGTKPPEMRRIPITEDPIAFNGYVLSSKKIQGIISNKLGKENGILVEINIGSTDPDTLQIERDDHFFTLAFGKKRHFIHICVPTGTSTSEVVMHRPIGGIATIEGP